MTTPPIRTITLGLGDEHPLTSTCIKQAAGILQRAQERYAGAGYEVQTLRLSTRPVFDDLASWSSSALVNYVQELQHMLDDVGLAFCSLGTAQAISLCHAGVRCRWLSFFPDGLPCRSRQPFPWPARSRCGTGGTASQDTG